MADVFYSEEQKKIMGINTPYGKPLRVRSINRGEFAKAVVYNLDTSGTNLTTVGNTFILGSMTPATILYELGITPVANATGNLKLDLYIMAKEKDTFVDLKKVFDFTPSASAEITKIMHHSSFIFKTLYEIVKDESNENFIAHKNDSVWYLAYKVETIFSTGANADPPTNLICSFLFCEGEPSAMPLENKGV